jgi:hypothetical protein
LTYERFQLRVDAAKPRELKTCTGTFQFGSDFYQANAKVTLTATGRELSMHWPSGESSALIPLGRDHFVDRSYWEEVTIERDPSGQPTALAYGHFRGIVSAQR